MYLQDRVKDELLQTKDKEISDLMQLLSSGGGLDHDCDSEPETPLPKVRCNMRAVPRASHTKCATVLIQACLR